MMNGRTRVGSMIAMLAGVALLSTCNLQSPVDSPPDTLEPGTWGGDRAGLIVNDTIAHVHINCTYGNFPAPIDLDATGRFSVSGDYLVRAYPVAIGPTMPAEFAGVLRGRTLTMTVAVNDTIEHRIVILGPATVDLGKEPQMGPCPICRVPGDLASAMMPSTRTPATGAAAPPRSSTD
jgi:hypothetical protein